MTRMRHGRLAAGAALVIALTLLLLGAAAAPRALAAESLSVNLASVDRDRGPRRRRFPLRGEPGRHRAAGPVRAAAWHHRAALRRSRHAHRGLDRRRVHLRDEHQGPGRRGDRAGQAVHRGVYHAQYQVLLSDIYGADGSQPSSTTWPCTGGNCANYVTFLDDVVGAIQASGVKVAYDIWNEPDGSGFWAPGFDTTQYFNMWNTAISTLKSLAPARPPSGRRSPATRSRTPAGGRPGCPPSRPTEPCQPRSPTISRPTATTRSRWRRSSTAT